MQSKAKDVETYIQEAPAERREHLSRLRALCLEVLDGCEEVMEYGMPVYKRDGVGEVAFANQKQYISLYIKADVVNENRPLLSGLSVGKVCIRYASLKKMDFDVVRKLLEDTVRSTGEVC